jgi:hypothetical protein
MRRATSGVVLIFVLLAGSRVHAQDAERRRPVDILVRAQALLHAADVVSTSYDLTHQPPGLMVHEANPLLRPFERNVVWLEAVNTGAVAAEIYFVKRLSRRHSRAATALAAGLSVAKAWAVVQNVRVAARIQAARRR